MRKILTNFYLLCLFTAMLLFPGSGEPAHAQDDEVMGKEITEEDLVRMQREVDSLTAIDQVMGHEIEVKKFKDSLQAVSDSLNIRK